MWPELQAALIHAKPGDDVAAILLHFGACDTSRTRVYKGHLPTSRSAMLAAIVSEAHIDRSIAEVRDNADMDGVFHALSELGPRPATARDAWERLCSAFNVRSERSPGYWQALSALATIPGFESVRPSDKAIDSRLSEVPF